MSVDNLIEETTIGIIGLSLKRFEQFCRISGFSKLNEREYIDGINRFICIDNIMYLYGRHFDHVVDFDPLRMEVYKRIVDKNRYHFGDLANLLKGISNES